VGKNAKQVGASVTHDCERDVRLTTREPLVARRRKTAASGSCNRRSSFSRHTHSHTRTSTCFAFFPTVFEEKRYCSQSTHHHDISLRWRIVLSARDSVLMDQSELRMKPPCERPLAQTCSQAWGTPKRRILSEIFRSSLLLPPKHASVE